MYKSVVVITIIYYQQMCKGNVEYEGKKKRKENLYPTQNIMTPYTVRL